MYVINVEGIRRRIVEGIANILSNEAAFFVTSLLIRYSQSLIQL